LDGSLAEAKTRASQETLTEKPAYRSLLKRHRCLIPADGFYEWTVGGDGKQPIHFHLPVHELFAFAGLWTSRTDDESGQVIESCTIITTRPNQLVAPVHDRMPVILPSDSEAVWLDPSISKEHALISTRAVPRRAQGGTARLHSREQSSETTTRDCSCLKTLLP
jgi:putative SOS response-associated peptidase YedK